MFKVIERPKFKHAVPIQVPVDMGHSEQTMLVTYRLARDLTAFDLNTATGSSDFLDEVICWIDDLVDEADKPVLFDSVRTHLLSLPYVRIGLIGGYFRAVTKAKPGN